MSEPTPPDVGTPPALNLLVVDDSAMMRALVKRAAAATGLPIGEIYEAADGRQALEILERHDVHALFTDINMPVMTGMELLEQIAGGERWRRMIRVIISSDGSEARRAAADALDVRHYVGKPFRPEAMRDVLADLTTAR